MYSLYSYPLPQPPNQPLPRLKPLEQKSALLTQLLVSLRSWSHTNTRWVKNSGTDITALDGTGFYPLPPPHKASLQGTYIGMNHGKQFCRRKSLFVCKTIRFQPGQPKRNHTIPVKLSQIPSLFPRWATASTGSFLLRQNLDFFTCQLSVDVEVSSARRWLFRPVLNMCNANPSASQTLCTHQTLTRAPAWFRIN